jgi:hypothetical protein
MEKNTWYTKYFKLDILDKDVNIYMKNFNKTKKLNLKDKLIIIEKEYDNKIQLLKNEFSNKNYINEFKKKYSVEILNKEKEIINIISEYSLKNTNLDYNFFKNAINMLLDLSNILKDRLNQPDLNHENYSVKTIPRCSYKFCNFKDSCLFNYTNKHQKCYQDHYVHNMICADIKVLLKYIEIYFKSKKEIIHNKEIQKSINTISFVISHMDQELKNKCLYQDKSEWESFHFTKKIINKIEKSNK